MLLAIDVGNTNTVFAVYDGDALAQKWCISSSSIRAVDEYIVWLTQLLKLAGLSLEDISAAIIASVVPQALFPLQLLCQRYLNCKALVVGEDNVAPGIQIKLADTKEVKEVGADRIVNAVAAQVKYGGPMIIVDFGTATTFDVIDEVGDYCGGVISPGVHLSVEALHMAAAKLPRISIEKPARVIGKGTIAAMRSGIFWGYVGLIEGVIQRIREELCQSEPQRLSRVLATGGLAPLFADEIREIEIVDQELTTFGLLELYKRNTGLSS